MIEELKKALYFRSKKKRKRFFIWKKTKNIIWQTNTANQGKGPYNFYLINDRKLILEDSNGKIL